MSSNLPLNQLVLPTNYNASNVDNYFNDIINNQPRATFEYTPPTQQVPVVDVNERFNQVMATTTNEQPTSEMDVRTGNVFQNALREGREIGTGLTYVWTHAPELLGEAVANVRDFYSGHTPVENVLRTVRQGVKLPEAIVNVMAAPYNFNLNDIGERSLRDIVGGAVEGAVHNPISTFADALSLGVAGAAVRGAKNVPFVGRLAKGAEAEKIIAAEGVNVATDINKLDESLKKVNQLAKDNNVNLARVVEAAETGTTVNKQEKIVLKELKDFSKKYDEFATKYSGVDDLVGAEETAIVQKILRDRVKVNPEMTYEQVRREVVPILNSGENITDLAKQGNAVAKEVVGAKALYDKGRIFPVTHALATVEDTTSTAVQGLRGMADATRAGRFANRLWGTASYDSIVEQLSKPENFLKDLTDRYMHKQMSNAILNNAFGIPAENSTRLMYFDRGLLENGQLQEALKSMRPKRLLDTDVAMDADMAREVKRQLEKSGSAFSNIANEVYQTGKSTMLAQGTYLGANAITGATNAIMNSGVGLLADVVNAIRSQGNLTKQLGVHRMGGKPQFSKLAGLRLAQQINYYTTGKPLTKADRWMQNKFAEIAAHSEFRRKGTPFTQRAQAIQDMDKASLGQMIVDIKRAALINSNNLGILPKPLAEVGSAYNPFWRWSVTATQASARILEKSPLLANVALIDVLSNIGFDREMQNRLNLNVSLDKPYVSFKLDKNGNKKVMNAEFVPLTTSIKTFDVGANAYSSTMPIMGTIVNSFRGLDKYGKPMKRAVSPDGIITQTVGTKRFQYDPRTGRMEEIAGQGDEILNTAIKTLVGAPNLWNRTVGPLMAPVFGEGEKFYQPYDQSLLGSFSKDETLNNIVAGGNALRGRTAQDVINILGGVYEQPYFESEGRISPRQQRQFFRNYYKDTQRRYYGE